ncbi:helix-turn-helix domain-containing protein [Collinsella tanakaei]|nr:helix-turn-helix domain-containing protein [Collinsella tanakaei]
MSTSDSNVRCSEHTQRLLTPSQAASIVNVSARTVTRLCGQGKLKAIKIGAQWRINRDALLEFAGLGSEHVA